MVNWEAIGAVGEFVGALAVVLTLMYVARDIRQNSRSLAMTALRDSTAQWNHWSEMIATSSDLADIVVKGNASYTSLSESETLRYGAYVQSFFDNMESARSLVVDHRVDHDLDVIELIVGRRLKISGFAIWWQDNSSDYDPGFVAWIDDFSDDG